MKTWTPEEEQYMERFYPTQSREQTAKALGRTLPSVINKAQSMSLARPCQGEKHAAAIYSDHDIALARALAGEGLRPNEIAHKLEMNPRTVRYYVNNPDKRPTQAVA